VRERHWRSQVFLWGALFFREKVDDLFLVVALKTQAKTTKLSNYPLPPSRSPDFLEKNSARGSGVTSIFWPPARKYKGPSAKLFCFEKGLTVKNIF